MSILTIGEAIKWAHQELSGLAFEDPALEARVILSGVLTCSLTDISLRQNEVLHAKSMERFKGFIARRKKYEPVAYLMGKKNFRGFDFIVDNRVLIPRPETEELVELAEKMLRVKSLKNPRILEIGCGSGCISVSLALAFPEAEVLAIDVSQFAIDVASKNGDLLEAKNTRFLKSNIYKGIGQDMQNHFDMIISNPPYVDAQDFARLQPDIKYEPKLALDGGPGGLSVIEPLVAQAPPYLKAGGLLMIEIGSTQAKPVQKLFKSAGFEGIVVLKDSGRLDRIVKGEKRGSV